MTPMVLGAQGDGGHGGAVWDLTDGSGAEVASGVYFVRVEGSTFRATKKVILLR